jgi:ParB-like chromosome segregation protein Spo0J
MTSFKQLTKDGVVKRKDAMQVRYADIVVDPNFNKRTQDERLQAHIQGIFQFIMGGGQLPDLEVVPLEGGKVMPVDGHCRHAAYGLAIAAGKDIEWIGVKPFNGDAADRTARIATSNEGLKLTPLEMARVYRTLRDEHDLGPEDIARKVGKTRQHVDQLLHLADAAPEVQKMVADGQVAATEAIKVARTHGDQAAKVLADAAKNAGKVTARNLKPWTPPAAVAQPVLRGVEELVDSLDTKTRRSLAELEGKPGVNDMQVSVPAAVLINLLNQHGLMREAEKKAAEKARAKAAKAAQGELVEGGA